MNDDNNPQQQNPPINAAEPPSNESGTPRQLPGSERIIQPLTSTTPTHTEPVSPSAPKVDAGSLYPEATSTTSFNTVSTPQQAAITETRQRSEDIGKPISQRVKPLLILAILGVIVAIYSLVVILGIQNAGIFGTILFIIGLVQLGMAVYLLIGKDHNTVALILKIYLVFQILSLFGSLASPMSLLVNLMIVIFIYYVYQRVKSLDYY